MAIAFTYTESTNTVVVTGGTSGTPATFADFVTADRAGTAVLLVATAGLSPTLPLDYQIRPVENKALLITFNVASKTTEVDYIFITGTDWRDAAQTESFDVSAGDGAYVSTKYFRTITNIDCSDNTAGGGTVWDDGTIEVTQPQWGVIWDYGGGQYTIDSNFDLGASAISTYLKSTREDIYFSLANAKFWVKTQANLQFGELDGDNVPYDGSRLVFNGQTTYAIFDLDSTEVCTVKLYDSYIDGNASGTVKLSLYSSNVTSEIINTTLRQIPVVRIRGAASVLRKVYIQQCPTYGFNPYGALAEITGCMVSKCTYGVYWYVSFGDSIITELTATGIITAGIRPAGTGTANLYLIDCTLSLWTVSWSSTSTTAFIYRQATCNIHISDNNGTNLAGVVVDCEDQYGTPSWTAGTVTTDANGDIAAQIISYTRNYYSGGGQTQTYSPHKFTFSKAGYKTLVKENITVDHPIAWDIELQYVAGARNQTVGMGVRMS